MKGVSTPEAPVKACPCHRLPAPVRLPVAPDVRIRHFVPSVSSERFVRAFGTQRFPYPFLFRSGTMCTLVAEVGDRLADPRGG